MSVGVTNSLFLSTFLYFLLSRNLPSMIPEFFCAGSKIEIVSSDKKKEMISLRSKSYGMRVLNLAVNLNTFLSLSTYLKKSLFGY